MKPANSSHGILAGPALRLQPDGRLVTLARAGCRPALEEIVRRYRPALLRYAATIVPPDRADDVVQDSLTRALPGIEARGRELHLRAWLYTIVRNTALNDLRDAGVRHERLDESYDGVEQPPQALDRLERVRALVAGLQRLPEPQREALVKREMEGMSHAQIGVDLGVSAGAARQLIFRARNALREGLGSLVPMPMLRLLVERGTAADAGAAGGGAVALKAAVAMLATGAAVTAGVAIRNADRHRARTVAESSVGRPGAGAAPSRRVGTPASIPESRPAQARQGSGQASGPIETQAAGSAPVGQGRPPGAPGVQGAPPGDGPSGGEADHGSSTSGGGSLSGATEDGGGRSSSDGTGSSESPQATDGGDSPGGTSTGSGDAEPSGSGSGGSGSGDGSTEPSPETSNETTSGTETTSGGSSGDLSATN